MAARNGKRAYPDGKEATKDDLHSSKKEAASMAARKRARPGGKEVAKDGLDYKSLPEVVRALEDMVNIETPADVDDTRSGWNALVALAERLSNESPGPAGVSWPGGPGAARNRMTDAIAMHRVRSMAPFPRGEGVNSKLLEDRRRDNVWHPNHHPPTRSRAEGDDIGLLLTGFAFLTESSRCTDNGKLSVSLLPLG